MRKVRPYLVLENIKNRRNFTERKMAGRRFIYMLSADA